jgi:hypothetical protein
VIGPTLPILAQSGGGSQQWVQLIVFLIILAGSGLSWVFKQLQAKAELKRRMDAAERRKLEALRTGRDVGAEQPVPGESSVTDRQRELAARRQAQLQELRRRQMERARAQTSGSPRPPGSPRPAGEPTRQTPLVIIPGSTGPIVVERTAPREMARPPARPERTAPREIPRPVARPEARESPREAPRHPASISSTRQAPQPPKGGRGKRGKAGQPAPRPVPAPSQSITRDRFTELSETAPAMQVSKVTADSPVMLGVPLTPEDWRRAIMAREILARPLSVRAGEPWEMPIL